MKKLPQILVLIFFIAPFSSCQKHDANDSTPTYDLIIEGGINSLTHYQFIRISKPADLYSKPSQPVSGAKVVVNDGSKDVVFTEIPGKGVYTASIINNKNYNDPYKLTVAYEGKYYTATDLMPAVLPVDSSYIPLSVKSKDNGYQVTIPKHIFGVSVAQRWLIISTNQRWRPSQFDGKNKYNYSHTFGAPNALNPLKQQQYIINTRPDDSLKIYKFSLSYTYSTYLYNIFQETDWRGVLSSTPANVKGNISGNANGFFYAIDVDTIIRAVKDLNN
ncbi:DUF4249 family protein [Chitinophaga sancti]|uniref:DUF4249 family protein n=1 Tax=Chitinophaga sancti TaxID=1004 RepID=A0A1K1T2Y2_9BACT|nr:DUF4249 family protein [Chitinophaga sancti]WQD63845.1 DUF4249 family protein [Chitinophaga sancti]WQG90530.1 DUF4249 family protein [Chitinophaga sancti]SFW90437.1 hypothetical protein SAMN05661012_06613 [Chitinophaga sancti]